MNQQPCYGLLALATAPRNIGATGACWAWPCWQVVNVGQRLVWREFCRLGLDGFCYEGGDNDDLALSADEEAELQVGLPAGRPHSR